MLISCAGAAHGKPCAASARIATGRARGKRRAVAFMNMTTACRSGALRCKRSGSLRADARSLRKRENRVAVGPRERERGGLAPRQPLEARVLRGIEGDRERSRHRDAEHALLVVRDSGSVAAPVPLEDLEAVLDFPIAQFVAG